MRPAVVLCMAGLYRRFRDAGYTLPKYLLEARGRTVLEQVVDGLGGVDVLVANRRDLPHEDAIRAAVDAEIVWIGDTSGQAETAAIGARHLSDPDRPLLFHNVDTVVRGRDLDAVGRRLARADGFVDTFDSDSPAFSYVAVEGDRVVDIREKVVISRHATSGLYGFRSAAVYLDAAAATTGRSQGEFYVSDVYLTMLRRGQRIEIEPDTTGYETIVLGTPAEYEAWRREPS